MVPTQILNAGMGTSMDAKEVGMVQFIDIAAVPIS